MKKWTTSQNIALQAEKNETHNFWWNVDEKLNFGRNSGQVVILDGQKMTFYQIFLESLNMLFAPHKINIEKCCIVFYRLGNHYTFVRLHIKYLSIAEWNVYKNYNFWQIFGQKSWFFTYEKWHIGRVICCVPDYLLQQNFSQRSITYSVTRWSRSIKLIKAGSD